MKPAHKPGKTPARAKAGKKRMVVLPGRPFFLVAASLALAVTLVFLALLLVGPQSRLPDGRLLSRPGDRQASAAGAPAKALHDYSRSPDSGSGNGRNDLPFEEHLSTKPGVQSGLSAAPEVRGKAEPPMPPAVAEPAGGEAAPAAWDMGKGPRMVVVIDDLGDHAVFAKNLVDLPFPVTLAILPNRPHTRATDAMAAEHGAEVILHQPMQPGSYPRVNPGPGAVFTDMDAERIKAQVAENLSQLPHAVGINNHMGSAFTENAPGMAAVMTVLRARHLFFLDSVTSSVSAAPEAARQAGVPLYRRAVFLDNVRNPRTILGQLKTAERLAVKRGRAIAIGHPYGETMEALKIWARERDPRIKLVTLTELGPES